MTPEPFIFDATLTLGWCFADEATTYGRGVLTALRSRSAVVPGAWFFDVASMLASAEERGRISARSVEAFLQRLRHLPIEIDYSPTDLAWTEHVPDAERLVLTPYHLPYLALARQRNLSLATLDDSLRAAARVSGVKLVEVVTG
jgi:predicted nucleic acid-binding protein